MPKLLGNLINTERSSAHLVKLEQVESMRKILFLLAVASTSLLFPNTASATQWVRVISTDELVIHIDVDSIKVEGNQRKFWQRDLYFSPQTIGDEYEQVNTFKRFSNINCSSKNLTTLRVVGYNATGSVIFDFDSRSSPLANFDSNETIPGTLGDSIVTLVCNRKIAGSYSGNMSLSLGLSRQQAINLVSKWLREKRQIFSPPFNQSVLSELTTGRLYADSINSLKWLRSNNARYEYGFQKIESVEAFSSNSNQAVLAVRVTEDSTLFVNGRIDPKSSGLKTRSIRYNLQFINGVWKIEDY